MRVPGPQTDRIIMFDPDALLTPLAGASPCGPDLDYDAACVQLDIAACAKGEQRIGHSIRAAVEPDWQTVRALGLALFSRTKDLRIAVHLLRAELRLDGPPALACGLQLIAGLLRRYDYAVHPMLDAEEFDDPTTRLSVLAPLGDAGAVLADLRGMRFGDPRGGITGRGIELACDSALPIEGKAVPSVDDVHLALQQEEQRSPGLLRRLGEAQDAARAIDDCIDSRFVDLSGLRRFIKLLLDATRRALGGQAEPPQLAADSATGAMPGWPTAPDVARIISRPPQPRSRASLGPEPFHPLDIDALLALIDPTEPCGPNLEYDAQFLQLEQAARAKAEQKFEKTIIPAEEPDWSSVQTLALTLFSRTKDLRVAVHLLRAATRLGGLEGAAGGLQLIHALLTVHWEGVHPTLDAGDDNDPTMRVNALAPLAHANAFVGDLRGLGFGDLPITGRSIELAAGDVQPGETESVPAEAAIRQALRAEAERMPALLRCAREAHEAAQSIESAIAGHVGDMATVLQPLLRFMQRMIGVMQRVLDEGADTQGAAAPEGASDESRHDAMCVLEQVCTWIEQAAFDAPRECRRAKRLTARRFIDTVRDLVPDGVDRVEEFFGGTPERVVHRPHTIEGTRNDSSQ